MPAAATVSILLRKPTRWSTITTTSPAPTSRTCWTSCARC